MSFVHKALAVLCPPLAVAAAEGLTSHVAWSFVYCFCGYIPAVIDAWLSVSHAARVAAGAQIFARIGRKKILFVGRGVIASLTGWALQHAGHHVDYLVRPRHMTEYKDTLHLDVLDCRGALFGVHHVTPMQTHLVSSADLTADNDYDLIIVSVQHYNFTQTINELAPKLGPRATLLAFNNLWEEPLEAIKAVPRDQVVWGFPSSGGGFPDNDHLVGTLLGLMTLGVFDHAEPSARHIAVRDILQSAGFMTVHEDDFRSWLYAHFAMNGALHGESLIAGGHMQVIASHTHRANVARNLVEIIPLLEARRVNVPAQAAQLGLARVPAVVGSVLLKIGFSMAPVRRILEFHSNPKDPLLTCRDMLEDAHARGVPMPALERQVAAARANGADFSIRR